ncbi:MAG: protease inhibitor I42 family protein [Planctomycetes bacterium]|nr:protease inhibitor I42 family protein [Planctomycetota bacterium]
MRKLGILAGLVLAGTLWAKDAEAPAVAIARLRYYVGGDEFIIRSPQGVKAVLDWLAQAEKGPQSEHAKTGACDRDAELELYAAAADARPARVVELFTGCKHVLKREVTVPQFAALRKIAEEQGERLLAITERDNGRTLDAAVGQPIEVRLVGDRPATGWEADVPEGGAVQRDAASPRLLFTPKPGADDKSVGTYTFRYRAVKPGQSKLRVVYVSPGGPGAPIRRRATALIKEFIVTIRVAAPPEKAGTL